MIEEMIEEMIDKLGILMREGTCGANPLGVAKLIEIPPLIQINTILANMINKFVLLEQMYLLFLLVLLQVQLKLYFIMNNKIKSIVRYTDKETGEVLDKYVIYLTNTVKGLKMYKNGLTETDCTSISLFDSYVDSLVYDAINGLKEGRIYADLLNNVVDKDNVINLLLCGADVEIEATKVDSDNPNNSLGYYYRYDVSNIKLNIDEFTKASVFEVYRSVFEDKSKSYLAFVAKMLGVYEIFETELV